MIQNEGESELRVIRKHKIRNCGSIQSFIKSLKVNPIRTETRILGLTIVDEGERRKFQALITFDLNIRRREFVNDKARASSLKLSQDFNSS